MNYAIKILEQKLNSKSNSLWIQENLDTTGMELTPANELKDQIEDLETAIHNLKKIDSI